MYRHFFRPIPIFLSLTAQAYPVSLVECFPVPPAAVVLMKLLPPPICFQVCSPFSWQIFALWVNVVIMYFFFIMVNTKWGYFNSSDYWGLSFLCVKIGSFCTSGWIMEIFRRCKIPNSDDEAPFLEWNSHYCLQDRRDRHWSFQNQLATLQQCSDTRRVQALFGTERPVHVLILLRKIS